MEHPLSFKVTLDVIFDDLRRHLLDIDDDGSVHGLLALDILRTTLEPELHGAALIERLMPQIADMWCFLQYREDLPEDLERILNSAALVLRGLLKQRTQSPPEARAAD